MRVREQRIYISYSGVRCPQMTPLKSLRPQLSFLLHPVLTKLPTIWLLPLSLSHIMAWRTLLAHEPSSGRHNVLPTHPLASFGPPRHTRPARCLGLAESSTIYQSPVGWENRIVCLTTGCIATSPRERPLKQRRWISASSCFLWNDFPDYQCAVWQSL